MDKNFTSFERSLALLFSNMPWAKKYLKAVYSRVVFLKHRKACKYITVQQFSIVSDEFDETFYGYYDKSPASINGYVINHSSKTLTKNCPDAWKPISVNIFDKNRKLLSVCSSAYNWQQGTRAHWITDDLFLFNDFDEIARNYIARVYSASSLNEFRTFDFPVQDSFKNEYFLSLNYRRLMALRPDYGYRNLPLITKSELKSVNNDGIWLVDFKNGEGKLIYSLEHIIRKDYKNIFSRSMHKVNHIMISPNGKKFIFLHRFYSGKRRFDRLMLGDPSGIELKVLAANEMVSHCFWADDNTILGYLRGPQNKDAYWLIDINTGEFNRLPNGALDEYGDGHPHVYKDWFVTDTYPDKARMQHLLLCNWKTGEVKKLGQFFHGFKYSGETRCDLHPRFSPDGKIIFFDSVFDGKRKLYKMEIEL